MSTETANTPWSLEVVRGAEPGRRFPLGRGPNVLGNTAAGINLASQEGASPRKMAAKQAEIDGDAAVVTIRDLDSPGGTFVNRQRVLAGEKRLLEPGDVIQVGGVQLKLIAEGSVQAVPVESPAPRPLALTLPSGTVCRSWDDVLTVSAQRWDEFRDELTSGRLAGYLAALGRADLAPDPHAPGSPDERLDAWLGHLPATRPSLPELDVFPRKLHLQVPEGGTLRKTLTVSNTGYRLLKTAVRVEPVSASWLRVLNQNLLTRDASELAIEATAPESFAAPFIASLVLTSNGGTITLPVTMMPRAASDAPPIGPPLTRSGRSWVGSMVAVRSFGVRERWGIGLALGCRLVVALSLLVPRWLGWPINPATTLPLLGPAAVFAVVGGCLGVVAGGKGGQVRDLPWLASGGAILGVLFAAVLVAACRGIEPGGGSVAVGLVLWPILGAVLGAVSMLFWPVAGGSR